MNPIVPTDLNDAQPPATRRRPAWVWLISVFYILSAGWSILSLTLVLSGAIHLSAAQQQYFAGLGPIDYAATVGLGVVTLWAAVSLFRLRRTAVPLFGASLVANLALTTYHAVTTTWSKALGTPGLVGAIIGLAVLWAIFEYAKRLRNRGILA